ncbi:NACHT and WD repeat domain-containing protein 2-like isoform X3 [Artemia franciscana]|uniref:NACHT and WD repeat domain-containing protein 2-like isoform X3 n=1 Tax=Artemia franciscana TaxID=6661 RepID=UPI0032DBDC2D
MDDKVVDRIFSGGLDHLPQVSSKIVRIFTSSTFTDTLLERNTLMAEVYPKLKEYCREKHGLEFQIVDMRWGVRDEATDDHLTTDLCMREIENCQRLSMGPNFISFLGQKYGYRPIPTRILTSELLLMREGLVGIGVDTSLLDTWYKPDYNAVPPVSILQSISSILVNFNNKRQPKLQQQDQATWWETLEKMQKLLRKAASTLYAEGKMDDEAMHNYFMSVTEREVINGLLNVKNTKNHCLSYVRIINNINLQNVRKAGLYIDILNRQVDTEAVRLMANLRDERVPNRIELTNYKKYTIDWIGRDGLAADTHEEYIQDFITHFYKSMIRLIDRAMRKEDSSPQGQIVTEILQHLHACNNSVRVFHGREDIVERVKCYVIGSSAFPLVLYGSGGCGKTSLLAKSASLIFDWLGIQKPSRRESYPSVPVEEDQHQEEEKSDFEGDKDVTTANQSFASDSQVTIGEEDRKSTTELISNDVIDTSEIDSRDDSLAPTILLSSKKKKNNKKPSSKSVRTDSQATTQSNRSFESNSSLPRRTRVLRRGTQVPTKQISSEPKPDKLGVGQKLSLAGQLSKASEDVKQPRKRVRFSHQAQMISLQYLQKVRSDSVEKEKLEMMARIQQAEAKKDDQPKQIKPLLLLRFCGTTPDSSALAPMLTSLCQQISYNYLLPFENIPTDLVPLTAYFKQLLTFATPEMPMYIFLDSVDQLGNSQDSNKLTWLPTKLPENVKVVASCSYEPAKLELSRDYQFLRRIIDAQDNFIEIKALGFDLAIEIIRRWLSEARRDLVQHQWEIVKNAIRHCSLPIFIKLVFAEVFRWRSYTKLQDTHLALGVIDSIMMLFQKIEIQHGRQLVFHALAYITASKSGLSETELEDLISLDDIVLDDVYQYHMPPVRRIPPLLWTRIKNDLPNYLSEREADGVSVQNWYHRQFRETALERYFSEEDQSIYFHSMIAEYFLGVWGGGKPKPFKYTEMQIMRFNLPSADGEADRKVPLQPLVFQSKDGIVSRYNLRKFGELPFHFIRSKRFDDLFNHVLFNYKWLHAKLAACPLQAVLSDFDDAFVHIQDPHIKRQITLVADALRLGGAILSHYPDMLAPQLLSRLLPESMGHNLVKALLKQCDLEGPQDCALIPVAHCLHTPGGPLKYSLEGHQFAVFGFKLTSDCRYIVSVSNKFLTFDMSTSDLARAVAPKIRGIFQGLSLSPDDKYASAWTSTNQFLILNMLTSEIVLLDNPLPESETIQGLHLLDTNLILWGLTRSLAFDSTRQRLFICSDTKACRICLLMKQPNRQDCFSHKYLETYCSTVKSEDMSLSGSSSENDQDQTPADNSKPEQENTNIERYCILSGSKQHDKEENYEGWMNCFQFSSPELNLQLQLSEDERYLLGTDAIGFCMWSLQSPLKSDPKQRFLLPSSVRNISVKLLSSNSIAISQNDAYAIAGVRKNLYVWDVKTGDLVKCLDAHFGRILEMFPYTLGPWNSIITSSLDRSVKIWNINNIFEQVHSIDRHELQIDSISLCESKELAVTVTRGCVGIWHLTTGKLVTRLADSPLGAIVTHAVVTKDGEYIISAESGNILIWNLPHKKVIYKTEQQNIKQLRLIGDMDSRFMAVSTSRDLTSGELRSEICVRMIPEGYLEYKIESTLKSFRPVVISSDNQTLIFLGAEKGKDMIFAYQAENGLLLNKFAPKVPGGKEILGLLSIPNKPSHVAVLELERGTIYDVKSKRHVKTIHRWSGKISKCGHFGLQAPSRGGLDLLEMRHGHVIRNLIHRTAEGVFTNVTLFSRDDKYVLYYHSGKKTLRMFRVKDGEQIANYRLSAELTAIDTTEDGKYAVIGTVDGNLTILYVADPIRPGITEEIMSLPWRKIQHENGYKIQEFSFKPEEDVSVGEECKESEKKITFKKAAHLAMTLAPFYSHEVKDGDAESQVCTIM